MKLSANEIWAINILKERPNSIIMLDGYLTGGHGIKLNLNTVRALKRKKLIDRNQISELGKEIKTT